MCHAPSVLPADHGGRADSTCLMCHQLGSTPTEPTSTPAPTSPTATPLPGAKPNPTETPAQSPDNPCLICHGTTGLSMTFQNGDTVPLTVDPDIFRGSVHGAVLECRDCHVGYEQVPHPPVNVDSYREYAIGRYEACRRCHFDNYTKALDSIHFEVLSRGNNEAPVCTDCHGAHDIPAPSLPRSRIAHTCEQCHNEIYAAYRESVHGQALISEENPDVPTCTYCHGVHNIGEPTTTDYHLDIPQLCGNCHSDKERMAKYGLSTDVLDTYLDDFHGTTIRLAAELETDISVLEAVCTDCHGIHDIVSVGDPSSPVLKANLVETCRKCHAGATKDFPSAWLSHYEPSLSNSPMVFLVGLFYKILIPVMVVGLVIHISLNLWRSAINR